MPKMEFGKAYCQDLLRRIIRKIILYFSMLYFSLRILELYTIFWNYKRK
jgi:hypothetical protein